MAWSNHFSEKIDNYNGYVKTYAQFQALKASFEHSTRTYFTLSRSKSKELLSTGKLSFYIILNSKYGNS